MSSDLENRVKSLEHKTGSLPYTMLALIVAMAVAAVMQYRIVSSLKSQIRDINRIPVQEKSYEK